MKFLLTRKCVITSDAAIFCLGQCQATLQRATNPLPTVLANRLAYAAVNRATKEAVQGPTKSPTLTLPGRPARAPPYSSSPPGIGSRQSPPRVSHSSREFFKNFYPIPAITEYKTRKTRSYE